MTKTLTRRIRDAERDGRDALLERLRIERHLRGQGVPVPLSRNLAEAMVAGDESHRKQLEAEDRGCRFPLSETGGRIETSKSAPKPA